MILIDFFRVRYLIIMLSTVEIIGLLGAFCEDAYVTASRFIETIEIHILCSCLLYWYHN